MPAERKVSRLVSIAAAVLAVLASVLPPVIFYSLSYEREAGSLEAEAEINAQLVTGMITANPDLWRYEQVRLSEYLSRRPRQGVAERRRVLDLDGNVEAESADPLSTPWIVRSRPLYDAGVRVGEIEIARSLRPLVYHALFMAVLLVPAAFLAFQILRTVPLRAIRRSERALRRQRDAAQRYLDVAEVGFFALDARGRVARVNRKGAEILGRPAAEIVGEEWVATFVDPRDQAHVGGELARLARSERVAKLEHAVVRPGGERRVLSCHLAAIPDRDGGPPGVLASGVDVTTERELEAQLRHAQKMEAIGELASGVAHGFNNALSTIKGYAAMLRRELPAGDPHLPDVDEIVAAADRAAALTRSLLTFSRHQAAAPEAVDLADVVRDAERLLRSLLPPGVELRTTLPDAQLPVTVDVLQIEQVLLNLVSNARDAMPDGGWVAVEASRVALDAEAARRAGVERPGDYARVSVSDTGVGIPPADQARVFEPFFTTKDVDKGTGLGLAIAYGIMKQHGGGIGLESEPGHGAAFTCYLPVRGAATDAPAVGLEAANAPAPEAEPRPERAAAAGRRDA